MIRCCVLLLLGALGATAQMRPPAVPLVAHDPYFSIWSMSDRLNGDGTNPDSGYRIVLAQAGISKDLRPGSVVGGTPAVPVDEWHKAHALVGRLPHLRKRVGELEQRLKGLEEQP